MTINCIVMLVSGANAAMYVALTKAVFLVLLAVMTMFHGSKRVFFLFFAS